MIIPQGITVDQYKRGIVDGSYTLSQTMQNILIINYTQPLKDYGSQFAAKYGLPVPNDAYLYFYSTFAPSTVVQNGKLVEGNMGLTASKMWSCTLNNFSTSNCSSTVMVSDKSNLSILATTSVNKLTSVSGNIGVLVMIVGFGNCIGTIIKQYEQPDSQIELLKEWYLSDTSLLKNVENIRFGDAYYVNPGEENFLFNIVEVFENLNMGNNYNVKSYLIDCKLKDASQTRHLKYLERRIKFENKSIYQLINVTTGDVFNFSLINLTEVEYIGLGLPNTKPNDNRLICFKSFDSCIKKWKKA